MLFGELVDTYLAWLSGQVARGASAPATFLYYQLQLRPLKDQFGQTELKTLTGFALEPWLTTWHRFQACGRLLHWGEEHGAEMPLKDPMRGIHRRAPGQRERTLSRLEMVKLLRASPRPLREILIGLRHTCGRPGEIRGLCWSYRTPDGAFALPDFKAKHRRKDRLPVRLIVPDARGSRLLARLERRRSRPPRAGRARYLSAKELDKVPAWVTVRDRLAALRDRLEESRARMTNLENLADRQAEALAAGDDALAENLRKAQAAATDAQALAKSIQLAKKQLSEIAREAAQRLRAEDSDIVFVTANGTQWTKDVLISAIRRVANRLGLRDVCSYTFRHSGATQAARNGVNLALLAQYLGHASVKMTQRYCHGSVTDMSKVASAIAAEPARPTPPRAAPRQASAG